MANGPGMRKAVSIAALSVAAGTLLLWLGTRSSSFRAIGLGDFIAYWAAGRVGALGGNPYAPEELLPLQQELGWADDWPDIMYYPPWTLPLVMPFGLLPFWVSRLAWLVAHMAAMLWCADQLWTYCGGSVRTRWVAWTLALSFVPTLIVLRMGQIGPLLLLGIVGFLVAERRGRDWLAGAALLLPAIKPQLTYLFGLGVLFWAVDRGRWRILAGGLAAGAAAVGLALLRNPLVWQEYRFAYVNPPLGNITPTLGSVLRLAFGEERTWLQFVPTVACLIGFPLYYALQRRAWRWQEQAPPLLLVSFLTTVYGAWVFDLVVLLVPLVQGAAWLARSGRPALLWVATLSYFALDGLALVMNLRQAAYPFYIWMTPAIFVGYLFVRSQTRSHTAYSAAVTA